MNFIVGKSCRVEGFSLGRLLDYVMLAQDPEMTIF